jgi:hypothetical protein
VADATGCALLGRRFHEQSPTPVSPILGASILWMPTYRDQPRGPVVVSTGRWHTHRHRYAFPTVSPGREFRRPAGQSILGKFVQVSARDAHSCALREDGAVYCWGRNPPASG